MRLAICGILLLMVSGIAPAVEVIDFTPPGFMAGPSVSHSELGVTYAYTAKGAHAAGEMQITVVLIPAELSEPAQRTPTYCLSAFLDALQARDAEFFAEEAGNTLSTGTLEMQARRWVIRRANGITTGVTACGVHRGRFVSINFSDRVSDAVENFAAIRSALRRLVLMY